MRLAGQRVCLHSVSVLIGKVPCTPVTSASHSAPPFQSNETPIHMWPGANQNFPTQHMTVCMWIKLGLNNHFIGSKRILSNWERHASSILNEWYSWGLVFLPLKGYNTRSQCFTKQRDVCMTEIHPFSTVYTKTCESPRGYQLDFHNKIASVTLV